MDLGPVILCVSEEPLLRSCLARILERAGATVLTAANGAEALEHLSRAGARPDVVMADLDVPGTDGLGLLRAMREDSAHASVPVIALSDMRTEAPFDLQLAKPFAVAELIRAVRTVCPRTTWGG